MMTTATGLQTALIQRKDGTTGLGLVDAKSQECKLHLEIRKLAFESELASKKLPKNLKQLLGYVIRLRETSLENRYEMVFAFYKLKQYGSWWDQFGFKNINQFFATFSTIPNGETLGRWQVLVEYFSRETFLLVGDEGLFYLMATIEPWEKKADKRKEAFQAIFDAYCAKYTFFDYDSFKQIVNLYINHTYAKTIAIQIDSEKHDHDPYKKPPRQEAKGVVRTQVAKPVDISTQLITPIVTHDLKTVPKLCAGCKEREEQLRACGQYIIKLREKLRTSLGLEAVPPYPKIIKEIFAQLS